MIHGPGVVVVGDSPDAAPFIQKGSLTLYVKRSGILDTSEVFYQWARSINDGSLVICKRGCEHLYAPLSQLRDSKADEGYRVSAGCMMWL